MLAPVQAPRCQCGWAAQVLLESRSIDRAASLGEQAGRIDLDRAIRRSAPAGPNLETLARTSSQGRGRPRHRLYGAGEDRPNPGADHDPPAKVGGVAAVAEPDGPERAGSND